MKASFIMLVFAVSPMFAAGADGEALYRANCAVCHSKPAERVPSESALRQLSAKRTVRTLETGSMSLIGFRLSRDEKVAVAEFVSGKPMADDDSAWLAKARCGSGIITRPFQGLDDPTWSSWSPDNTNTRLQATPGFLAADVPKLELKWAFGFAGDAVAFAQPTVAAGRVFVGSAGGDVYSLDAKSGCVIWRYQADASVRTGVTLSQRSGTEVGRYTAYFGDFQGNVYAVDANSGKLLWRRRLDTHPFARITATPVWHLGRLYVATASFEEGATTGLTYECCTFRGSVSALDARTGEPIWKTYTIPTAAKPTIKNKAGLKVYGPSGAAVWATPTIDLRRRLLYVATGDNYTSPATPTSDAVLALSLDSGAIAWVRQLTSNDVWHVGCGAKGNCPDGVGPDHDFGSSPMLTRAGSRDLVIAAQKSGVVYALDPEREGEVRWQTRIAEGGEFGGIQWGPAADGQRVYAAISDLRQDVRGINIIADPAHGGGLAAIRIADGVVEWKAAPPVCADRPQCSPAQSAAVTAVPGVIFSGARDGLLRAYAADDGKIIWSTDTMRSYITVNGVEARGGAMDGAGPAIAGGMLFVNSGYAWWGGRPGNVLLAFGLPAPNR